MRNAELLIQITNMGFNGGCGNVKFTGSGVQNYAMAVETIPEAFRPLADQSIIAFPSCGFSLLVMRDGTVQMLGDPKSAYSTAHGCWMTE